MMSENIIHVMFEGDIICDIEFKNLDGERLEKVRVWCSDHLKIDCNEKAALLAIAGTIITNEFKDELSTLRGANP